MAPDETEERARVTVAYSPTAGRVDVVEVELPLGGTALMAMGLSGLCARHPELDASSALGIWSQRCTPETVLRDLDRLEIYRPLQVDPKDARRVRHQKQRGIARG